MPHNITDVRVAAPPDLDSHFLVTRRGDIFRFSISEPDYTVGRTRGEMLGFPGGAWVPASSAPGRLPEAASYELVVSPRPVLTLRQRTEELAGALPLAAELHRPDGRYLRVYNAEVEDYTSGTDTLTALFKPKSEVWRYPLLDDAFPEILSGVFETEQSTRGAPIYATTPGSRLTAPITAARLPQGAMFVGLRTEATGVYGIASLGSAVGPDGLPKSQAIGMYKNNGVYRAHVGTQTVDASQDATGGYGLLKTLAMSWRENGLLSFYSFGANGFVNHGNAVLGEVEPFALRQITLGVLSNFAGIEGFFMPGAPALGDFGVPFYTARHWNENEIHAALESHYTHLAQFDTLTIKPPPYGLTLTVGPIPDLVTGRTVQVPLTVNRKGGFLGDIEFLTESPNPSLRIGEPIASGDASGETYNLPETAEEGITAGEYTVTVTVRAVGQNTSDILKDVIDTKTHDITVRLGDPALPEGTLAFDALYDPQNKSFATMNKNLVAGATTRLWTLQGLTSYTSRWDGLRGDGTDSVWGKATATIDSYVTNMAADHTVSRAHWDVNLEPVGTVLFTVASQTNKFDYWQVYKSSTGIKIRTSAGTTTSAQAESGQAITALAGVMDMSVVVTGGQATLLNPKTSERTSTPSRAWVGAGRLTAFGAKLSDGTIQGLSKGITLAGAVQERAVSEFQLERQAEYFRGWMLRTAQWERPEYPAWTYAIFLGDPGQGNRNYHPATSSQSMIARGAGAVIASGSFVTDGLDEVGWRTGWITKSDTAKPNDFIVAMRDMQLAKVNGGPKFGTMFYYNDNTYFRFGGNAETISKFFVDYRVSGDTNLTVTDSAGNIPITGVQAFCQRLNPAGKRSSVEHIATGRTLERTYDAWAPSGMAQITVGCEHRGLTSTGTIRGDSIGLGSEVAANSLGIIMVAKHTTVQERKDAAANITGVYDYTQAPAGGGGSGGTTAPTGGGGTITQSASDVTAVAIAPADWNATTLFGASGPMRDMSNRLMVEIDKGGYGRRASTNIYFWNDTAYSYRGQYHTSRRFGEAALGINFALRAHKHFSWAKQSQTIWNHAKSVLDLAGGPESTTSSGKRGWTYGTDSGGTLARDGILGKRITLEAGVAAKCMVHAYNMHVNRHLDSTFAASRDEMVAWYLNDYVAEWDTYYSATNTTQFNRPLHSKKGFSHTTMSEIVGLLALALIQSGALWYNNAYGIEALDAFALWYQVSNTTVIPVSGFKDAAWASYGPARLWGQRNAPWNTGGQFTSLQTYFNETGGCLMFLYLEGFLTRALGSQAAADTFMTEVVSGANLGIWAQPLVDRKLVADSTNGHLIAAYSPTGVAGPWMFTTNPFGGADSGYDSETKILKGYNTISALDSSNRLTTIHDDVMSRYAGARDGTDSQYRAGNIDRLLREVWIYGRKNT